MILAECPVCHQKPVAAGNTFYCPHCGWNRDSAIASIRMSLNAWPIGLFMFVCVAAFLYWGMKFNRTPILMIFWCVPAAGILLNYIVLKRSLKKLFAMPGPSNPSPIPSPIQSNWAMVAENAAPAPQTFGPSSHDEALLRIPAPRRVRMSKGGRLTTWVVAFGLSLFVLPLAINMYHHWTLYHSFANVQGLGWAIGLQVVVALAAYGIWRGQVSECDLLEHGEVVMGRVLSQRPDNKNNSWIDYEFTDFLGSSHRGGCIDRTNKLFAGMSVPVFYDRDKPSRQIAACTTLHEVVLPSEPAYTAQELIAKR